MKPVTNSQGMVRNNSVQNGHMAGRTYADQVARLKMTSTPPKKVNHISKGFDVSAMRIARRQNPVTQDNYYFTQTRAAGYTHSDKKGLGHVSKAGGAP